MQKDIVIDHKDLEFTKKLGSGVAGEVFKGLFKGQMVAIKVLKETIIDKELLEFQKEVKILW